MTIGGKPHIEEDEIESAPLKAFITVATDNRLQLFRLIHEEHPESVCDLAKRFERDLSYDSEEVQGLESLGLVRLQKKTVQGRERLKPMALYDRFLLDFDLAD